MQRLLDERIATYKKYVIVTLEDGATRDCTPGPWLAQKPWNVEIKTLHIDRVALDERIRVAASDLDIRVVEDRVTAIEFKGDRMASVTTASGLTIQARFYLDASGVSARLMPRRIESSTLNYGPPKIALWNYFTVTDFVEGITLHTDCGCWRYMEWIGKIPIDPSTVSVGYVAPADVIKGRRRQDQSVEQIYAAALTRVPRLAAMLPGRASPRATHRFLALPCARARNGRKRDSDRRVGLHG